MIDPTIGILDQSNNTYIPRIVTEMIYCVVWSESILTHNVVQASELFLSKYFCTLQISSLMSFYVVVYRKVACECVPNQNPLLRFLHEQIPEIGNHIIQGFGLLFSICITKTSKQLRPDIGRKCQETVLPNVISIFVVQLK